MFINALLILASIYVAGTWLGGLCTAALILIWRLLPKPEGPPVLALAMTTQWAQVSMGVYYAGFTGRPLETMEADSWQTMVLIGLGCVVATTIGLRLGSRYIEQRFPEPEHAPHEVTGVKNLIVVYIASIAVTGLMQEIAWSYPAVTQAIIALASVRLALVYLLLRRFLHPQLRWELIILLLGFEVGLGFTGYFSSFKEPLLLAGLAMLEAFNPRRREHWVFGGALAATLAVAVVMWMGVRAEYRAALDTELEAASRTERLERMQALSTDWFQQSEDTLADTVDDLIWRSWAVYYPALALDRVPAIIPHTEGELISNALFHIVTPRFLFPNKADLPNESEMVRKYSGIWVAGSEAGTSIAFGYAGESYVDFGLPWMFLPSLAFGAFMGAAYMWLLRNIQHRELAIALVTCVFWLNLYLFERSWARLLGLSLTMMAYLGGAAFLLDRWLLLRENERIPDPDTSNPAFGATRH